jgi:hypothetical protein
MTFSMATSPNRGHRPHRPDIGETDSIGQKIPFFTPDIELFEGKKNIIQINQCRFAKKPLQKSRQPTNTPLFYLDI